MIQSDKILNPAASYVKTLLKWLALSTLVGIISGYLGSFFHISIDYATKLRTDSGYLIYLLPLAGLVIVFFYNSFRSQGALDTNRILRAASKEDEVPLILAPLIFMGTVLTHLFGGSAGREGAALQLGGTIGMSFGKLFKLNGSDKHIIVMSGMSAVFAALFGTPLTAAVFSLEVCSVGLMHYAALVPCVMSAAVAAFISRGIGLSPVGFSIAAFTDISLLNAGRILLLIVASAMVAMLFCYSMKKCEHLFKKYMPSPYVRVFTGGIIIVGLSIMFSNGDYNGAGMHVVERAIAGKADSFAFLIKILFTVITISAGFKGGEIVPAFFIGSCFGCTFANFIGLDPSLGASLGFVAVFCSVVNCPVASIILAIEIFGTSNLLIFALCASISYMMSGYCGLYSSQRIVFSKLNETILQENNENGTKEICI